jgi:hypothetical protein
MSEQKEVQPFYRQRAKEVTDMLFDKRFLNDDLDRETTNRLEDFLGWLFQSQCEFAVRSAELAAKFRDSMRPKPEPEDSKN